MKRMDRFRRIAGLLWIVGGLVAMLVWSVTRPSPGAGAVTWMVSVVAALAAACQLAAPHVRWWAARLAGVVIGILLLGAVADRFGLLGANGDPGVSWGDWSHFRAETAQLVPWSHLVSPAAVAATLSELVLGALLLAGLAWRWTGKLAAGLFVVYLVAMVPGMGPSSVLQYGIPVLIGGCLLVSARGERQQVQHRSRWHLQLRHSTR
jgi:uncharacterized membrane protein YphA (DoxX/SURF4 family)